MQMKIQDNYVNLFFRINTRRQQCEKRERNFPVALIISSSSNVVGWVWTIITASRSFERKIISHWSHYRECVNLYNIHFIIFQAQDGIQCVAQKGCFCLGLKCIGTFLTVSACCFYGKVLACCTGAHCKVDILFIATKNNSSNIFAIVYQQ